MSLATFSLSGKIPLANKRFIMFERGSEIRLKDFLMTRTVILSYPGALSSLRELQMFCSSSGLVGLREIVFIRSHCVEKSKRIS